MRVVLDSNVIIAAYATHGLCHSLLELCLVGHTLVLSEHILKEVGDKLHNKIKVPAKTVKEILASLKKTCQLEQPIEISSTVCRDPDDVKILGLAVGARADCLVSGDQDLLVLKRIQEIPIFSPREFYNKLTAHDS
jgi:putative PIN family toxin of toxin-antitoxin system